MGTKNEAAAPHPFHLSGEIPETVPPGPPERHYCPETGEWDGQLPLPGIAAAVPTPNWPGISERITWSRAVTRAYRLSPSEAATLLEIAFRDDRMEGCTASMKSLGLDTGFNERTIRKAVKELERKRLILAHDRPGRRKIMGLPIKNCQLPWPSQDAGAGPSLRGKGRQSHKGRGKAQG